MRTIAFVGAKGGVGTTTIAAAVALHIANSTKVNVHLRANNEDAVVVLGLPLGEFRVTPNLTTCTPSSDPGYEPDVLVIDGGTDAGAWGYADDTYLIVRNEYIGLRRAMAMPRPSHLLLLREPNRALDAPDIAAVLDLPMTVVDVTPEIGRMVDAGLMYSAFRRLTRHLATVTERATA